MEREISLCTSRRMRRKQAKIAKMSVTIKVVVPESALSALWTCPDLVDTHAQ
jgi:hypothetical protein